MKRINNSQANYYLLKRLRRPPLIPQCDSILQLKIRKRPRMLCMMRLEGKDLDRMK